MSSPSRSHTDTPRKLESWCGFGPYCTDDTPCDVHALVADAERLAESNRRLVLNNARAKADLQRKEESLTVLRDAWNAHMETCPQHAALPVLPSFDDLQAWRDAPSGTASADA